MRSKFPKYLAVSNTLLVACAQSQFNATRDVSSLVRSRVSGLEVPSGRAQLDCFSEKIDGSKFNSGKRPDSIGIPINCPASSTQQKTSSNTNANKFDISIVFDASENMAPHHTKLKGRIVGLLKSLHAEGHIASLTGVSFRTDVVARAADPDPQKVIAEITGSSPDWNPNNPKIIDPKSTDWIKRDWPAVFVGIEEGIKLLQEGRVPNKMLILVTASTSKIQRNVRDTGTLAGLISNYTKKSLTDGGQFILSYAANDQLASWQSDFEPSSVEQLDQISSMAGVTALRSLITENAMAWEKSIISAASAPVNASEDCLLTSLEAADKSGQSLFKKTAKVSVTNGMFEVSLPSSIESLYLNLKITRSCARSGERVQMVTLDLAHREGTAP